MDHRYLTTLQRKQAKGKITLTTYNNTLAILDLLGEKICKKGGIVVSDGDVILSFSVINTYLTIYDSLGIDNDPNIYDIVAFDPPSSRFSDQLNTDSVNNAVSLIRSRFNKYNCLVAN